MVTTFRKLNEGWNAEPNAPEPQVKLNGKTLELSFFLNPWQFPEYAEGQHGRVTFTGVSHYRLGSTNDEGWYCGQCRFSGMAPKWGEFYEVGGDLLLQKVQGEWVQVTKSGDRARNHYLFYFRDETFECDADGWQFSPEERGGEPA